MTFIAKSQHASSKGSTGEAAFIAECRAAYKEQAGDKPQFPLTVATGVIVVDRAITDKQIEKAKEQLRRAGIQLPAPPMPIETIYETLARQKVQPTHPQPNYCIQPHDHSRFKCIPAPESAFPVGEPVMGQPITTTVEAADLRGEDGAAIEPKTLEQLNPGPLNETERRMLTELKAKGRK